MKKFLFGLAVFMVAFAPFQAHGSTQKHVITIPPTKQCISLVDTFNKLTDLIESDFDFRTNTYVIRQQTVMHAMIALKCHELYYFRKNLKFFKESP